MLQVLKRRKAVPAQAAAGLPEAPSPLPSPTPTVALTELDTVRDPRGPLWAGMIVIAVAFFGLGTWAALAPLGSAAIAPGVVVAESSHRVIQHLEGGIIKDLLVQDGSVVKEGDVLVRMDNTRTLAQLEIFQSDLSLNQAIEARLLAERDNAKVLTFPPELLARQKDPAVGEILTGQRNMFVARQASLDGQKAILEQRVGQYQQQIVGLRALELSKREQARYIKDELDGLISLMNQGIVPKTRVLALQREASRLEGERGDHISAIARSEQGIGETKLQSLQLDKTRQEEITKDLRDTQAKLAELKQKMIAATDAQNRIEITAPVAGTVMSLNYHTIGGVIGPGSVIMEIIPGDDTMVVECQINPMDIDSIQLKAKVSLHVSVVESRLTPMIYGVLDSISPDRVVDQKTGASYFKGRISITKEELDRLDGIQLRNGMQVEAFISRGEQTVLRYALKPLLDSMSHSFREK